MRSLCKGLFYSLINPLLSCSDCSGFYCNGGQCMSSVRERCDDQCNCGDCSDEINCIYNHFPLLNSLNATSNDTLTDASTMTVAIAGGLVGVLLAIGLPAALIIILVCRSRRTKEKAGKKSKPGTGESVESPGS